MDILPHHTNETTQRLANLFFEVRKKTESLVKPITAEDAMGQSATFTSPAKWHLAHTSWFFERFVLQQHSTNHSNFNESFDHLFNSYYNTVSKAYSREQRGLISRPTLEEILEYRTHVDNQIMGLLEWCSLKTQNEIFFLITLGVHHEQQHQELLLTDIKHLFWQNPLLPTYQKSVKKNFSRSIKGVDHWLTFPAGLYEIGITSSEFSFDNERPAHRYFSPEFTIATKTVTNHEFLEFIKDGGYDNPLLWLSDGWDEKNKNNWSSPLYWVHSEGGWEQFTLSGVKPLDPNEPACHVSFYEADAYARWKGMRLPTEAELEIASKTSPSNANLFLEKNILHPLNISEKADFFGNVWDWSSSPYQPYKGFREFPNGLGEYNGKFMINQIVLKGGSCLTPHNHIRPTYRNFFYPEDRWQMSGFRLAKLVNEN